MSRTFDYNTRQESIYFKEVVYCYVSKTYEYYHKG